MATAGADDLEGRSTKIRVASEEDIPIICKIERSATHKFATIDALAELAEHDRDPLEPTTVQAWLNEGQVLVAETEQGVIAFVAAIPKDGVLYIPEIDVSEAYQGGGLGGRLLNAVFAYAQETQREISPRKARVTLTTYPDVPWNGPWYRKHGFREVAPREIGPWHLGKAQEDEQELTRPGFRRCCMLWESSLESSPMTHS